MIRCSELEGNWLYLTGTVPDEFLHSVASDPISIAEGTSALLGSDVGLVDIAAPTLHLIGSAAMEEELRGVASNLRSIVESEGDGGALEQATVIFELTAAQKDECEADLNAANSAALLALNNAIAEANLEYKNAIRSANIEYFSELALITIAVTICLAAVGWWTFGVGAAACLIIFASALAAITLRYYNAIVSALDERALKISNAWAAFIDALQGAQDVYEACIRSANDNRQTQLSSILGTCTSVSQAAIFAAKLKAEQINEKFTRSAIFEQSGYEVVDGILLSWPSECFE